MQNIMSTKLTVPNAEADRVGWLVEMISNQIMDGSLQQGEKLNEPRLSRRFGRPGTGTSRALVNPAAG